MSEDEHVSVLKRRRGWYWKVHGDEYRRWQVGDLPQFCGWPTLLRLVEEAEHTTYYDNPNLYESRQNPDASIEELRRLLIERDKALLATCFETGGRVSEVLALKTENFTVEEDRVVVRDMPCLKRFKKIREVVEEWRGDGEPSTEGWHWSHKHDGWVRRRFQTQRVMDRRNVLEIPRFEPLVPFMLRWLEEVGEGWLFPRYCKAGNPPISATRAYTIVRDLGERIGLVKPDHVTTHWFRSQRASQLASEYRWRTFELRQFFSWRSDAMPHMYAKLAPLDLYESMRIDRIRLTGFEGVETG